MITNVLITEKNHKTSWRAIFLNNENASSSLKMGVTLLILMVTLVNTPISGGHGAQTIHFLQQARLPVVGPGRPPDTKPATHNPLDQYHAVRQH